MPLIASLTLTVDGKCLEASLSSARGGLRRRLLHHWQRVRIQLASGKGKVLAQRLVALPLQRGADGVGAAWRKVCRSSRGEPGRAQPAVPSSSRFGVACTCWQTTQAALLGRSTTELQTASRALHHRQQEQQRDLRFIGCSYTPLSPYLPVKGRRLGAGAGGACAGPGALLLKGAVQPLLAAPGGGGCDDVVRGHVLRPCGHAARAASSSHSSGASPAVVAAAAERLGRGGGQHARARCAACPSYRALFSPYCPSCSLMCWLQRWSVECDEGSRLTGRLHRATPCCATHACLLPAGEDGFEPEDWAAVLEVVEPAVYR